MGVLTDLASEYWYLLVAIIIFIIGYIWVKKVDYYTKRQIRETLSGKTLFIVVFIITWVLWHRYGDMITMKQSSFWMPVIFLGVGLIASYMGLLKYETRQVLCRNYHGSFNPDPLRVNGFLIFSIGSFNAGGLSMNRANEILVIREETGEIFDKGFVSIARVSPTSRYDLDPDVKHVIENTSYLKPAKNKVFYGWFDDIDKIDWTEQQLEKFAENKESDVVFNFLKKEIGVDNPSIKEMFRLYRNTNKGYNKQSEVLDSTVETVEKGVEHHKRIKDAYVQGEDKRIEGHEET